MKCASGANVSLRRRVTEPEPTFVLLAPPAPPPSAVVAAVSRPRFSLPGRARFLARGPGRGGRVRRLCAWPCRENVHRPGLPQSLQTRPPGAAQFNESIREARPESLLMQQHVRDETYLGASSHPQLYSRRLEVRIHQSVWAQSFASVEAVRDSHGTLELLELSHHGWRIDCGMN